MHAVIGERRCGKIPEISVSGQCRSDETHGAASFDQKDYCISNTALKSVEKYAYDPNLKASRLPTFLLPEDTLFVNFVPYGLTNLVC